MKNRHYGFTLVELIVVILILGVLAATALPRFINLNDKAYQAAVSATGGAFGTAISLAKAQWIANGHTQFQADLSGFGDSTADVSSNGWVLGNNLTAAPNNDNPITATNCEQIWNTVLNNPPIASTNKDTAGAEYEVSYVDNKCTYKYIKDEEYSIVYDTSSGNVEVDTIKPDA